MTDLDCRILSRACGLCWHIENPYIKTDNGTYLFSPYCKECGEVIYKDGWYYGGLIDNFHHDFTTADDWELVRVKVVVPNKEEYSVYLWERWHYEYETKRNAGVECLSWYLSLSDEDRNQIAADFIKSHPDLFPWVEGREEERR